MFDVTSLGAQDALSKVADWGQRPTSQLPMPSPNAVDTPMAGKKAQKSGDLAQKLARSKSQEFKSKILEWNQAGGGIAPGQKETPVEIVKPNPADEVVVIEEDDTPDVAENKPESDKPQVPSPTKSPLAAAKAAQTRRTSKDIDRERKAWVRRKSKPQIETIPQEEVDADIKAATTPKKRVVSDGHWRRDRSKSKPQSDMPAPEDVTPPKPITIRRSVVNVGLKVPPSVQDFYEEPEAEPGRRRPISSQGHSRQRSREDREDTPDYEDSGMRVYIKRRPRSKTSVEDPKKANSEGSSLVSGDHKSSSTDITTPSTPSANDEKKRPSTAPRERIATRSLTYHEIARRLEEKRLEEKRAKTPDERQRASPKPQVKPPPAVSPIVPKVFGGRIEGWLATTSDPFSEPTLAPEPLAPRKAPAKSSDNKDGSVDDKRPKASAHRKRSQPSLDNIDTSTAYTRSASPRSIGDDSEVSGASTPTLKRRGARRDTHSPVKDRGRHASSPLDNATVTSEDVSTLRSGQPLSENGSIDTLTQAGPRRSGDGHLPRRKQSEKRGLTKHSDLISVLSMPRAENKGITSARSIRTQRVKPGTAKVEDVMNEITTDELKYQRELRTLVDGVIPVLLQSVLSHKDASGKITTSTGLAKDEPTVTQPIINMGVALERLKTSHKRIPMHNPQDLVRWAQQTAKIYDDYLRAWRLGFEDLVVTLAPVEGTEKDRQPSIAAKQDGPIEPLAAGDGERVEVAYLLKRPLVRLKYLARGFKSISQLSPSPSADEMAVRYQKLVQEARDRSNDERARLEDEAAAAIDPSRSRDLRSLAPLSGVRIDPTRCVRARDYFDMDLRHTSGQQLTCRIEIIIRDDAPKRGNSTDLLFCEVTSTGRWLLFPPVLTSMVSVRPSRQVGELVLMVRGFQAQGKEWRELMSLRTDDDDALDEWLDMLPDSPAPPSLMKKSSFDMLKGATMSGALPTSPPSPNSVAKDVDIPIGERAKSSARIWDGSDVNSMIGDDEPVNTKLRRSMAHRHRTSPVPSLVRDAPREEDEMYAYERPSDRSRPASVYSSTIDERPKTSYTRSTTDYTPSILSRSTTDYTESSGYTYSKKDYSVWLPSSQGNSSEESGSDEDYEPRSRRPALHRQTSSVPSLDLPTINKTREAESHRDSRSYETPRKRSSHRRAESTPMATHGSTREPASAPAKVYEKRTTPPKDHDRSRKSVDNSRPTSLGLKSGLIPALTPNFLKKNRRSSSPLKHEYAPSSESESFTESDYTDYEEDDESITSESSAGDEQVSTVGELKTFPNLGGYKPMAQASPPDTQYSPSDPSLAPSQSASQAPYRTVPTYDDKASSTIASIFAWVDAGLWDSLHPEECFVVVSPGLIEAFDLAQAQAAPGDEYKSPSTRGVKPLIALELTPLVPLRRGTALDISIRSPPTANSLYKPGANIMFRSRNGEECEELYFMINRARINNPTYIALQNARGPMQQSNWGEAMDRRNQARTSPSWWNLGSKKGSTYRSKGSRRISAPGTESSIGTMNTAFSALRRMSGSGNRLFNIAKSTITSKESPGSRSTYSDSLSSGAVTPMGIDPRLGTPLGLTDMKIRLYLRESASKWRDMGSARMTVVLPPRPDPEAPADPRTIGQEKRIIISGKTKGETLVDATLGETAFERVARTGIAVSVWEEQVGPNGELGQVGAVGGVNGARQKVYMVQMKSVSPTVIIAMQERVLTPCHRNATRPTLSAWLASYATNDLLFQQQVCCCSISYFLLRIPICMLGACKSGFRLVGNYEDSFCCV